jgi:glycosyltransferase involved in cell wall biosynthesis
LGINNDAVVIVMVARLELYKGHMMLLKALRQVVTSTNHKIVALFVGIGKDRLQIEKEAARLGLTDNVLFTGYRLDVPNIISASDISILTSRYEGIPRALMESMLLGLPVIATNVPGSRTLVRSRENGILVEHDDDTELATAIKYLIDKPYFARQLANHGKQTVLQEFDEYKVADRVEDIYKKVLNAGLPQLSERKLEVDL